MASTVMPNGSLWSLRVLPAQAEELVAVDLQLRQVVAEVVLDQLRREDVVAGRDRRVRGEARCRR